MSRDWPIVVGGIRQAPAAKPRITPNPARPVVLHELKHPPFRAPGLVKRLRWTMVDGLFALFEIGAICLVVLLAYVAVTLPNPDVFQTSLAGNELAASKAMGDATPVRLAELPQFLPDSVIKVEGDAFYQPMRIDVLELISVMSGITKAAEYNATIAQRLAATLLPPGELSDLDILRQWMLGLRLESRYTREQLLEIYLNRTTFGEGVVGIDDAAHRYFGKDARLLTHNESMQLAVLVDLRDKTAHGAPGRVALRAPFHDERALPYPH